MNFNSELYNRCYEKVAARNVWRNRDFDKRFDRAVDELYMQVCRMIYTRSQLQEGGGDIG
jgi:hypothetical protein